MNLICWVGDWVWVANTLLRIWNQNLASESRCKLSTYWHWPYVSCTKSLIYHIWYIIFLKVHMAWNYTKWEIINVRQIWNVLWRKDSRSWNINNSWKIEEYLYTYLLYTYTHDVGFVANQILVTNYFLPYSSILVFVNVTKFQ